tara:strand:+ start:847 stop:1080 length:234 start_codon:yes stop_codon:yes gene_type:complete
MSKIEDELRKEIAKWLPKAKAEVKKIKKVKDEGFLTNIKAYIKDTEYFLEKGDLVKGFEAVVWAWAWLEIGKRKKIL